MVMQAPQPHIQITRTSPAGWQIVIPDTDEEHRRYALEVLAALETNTLGLAPFYGVNAGEEEPPEEDSDGEDDDEDYED